MTEISAEKNLSFDEAIRRCEVRVLRIAYRMLGSWADAEDTAQDTFVRLHKNGWKKLEGDEAVEAWVCRVAVNLCLDRLRSRSRWRTEELMESSARSGESAEGAVLREERKRMLAAALGRLPERERAAVVLREMEGLSTAETATALGSTEVTVRSQISKGMARLRAMLEKEKA